MKYFIDCDQDCHNYLIPVEKRKDWEEWSRFDFDDNVPEYAIPIDGISRIEFEYSGINPPMTPVKSEITVKLEDGHIIYWPEGDFSRLAPAAVCNIAAKILQLRKILKDHGEEIPQNVKKKLEFLAEPFAFESSFLSSSIVEVHRGIKEIGKLET